MSLRGEVPAARRCCSMADKQVSMVGSTGTDVVNSCKCYYRFSCSDRASCSSTIRHRLVVEDDMVTLHCCHPRKE